MNFDQSSAQNAENEAAQYWELYKQAEAFAALDGKKEVINIECGEVFNILAKHVLKTVVIDTPAPPKSFLGTSPSWSRGLITSNGSYYFLTKGPKDQNKINQPQNPAF